jgi:hypothetical protein
VRAESGDEGSASPAELDGISSRALLKKAFSKSDLPFRVGVLKWAAASPDFRSAIEKDLVELGF